jgi:hypothetical protein
LEVGKKGKEDEEEGEEKNSYISPAYAVEGVGLRLLDQLQPFWLDIGCKPSFLPSSTALL